MAYGTVNADVIQTSTSGGILGAGNASIMKNRIINGAMVIDQRNAGASVTPADSAYTLDRWQSRLAQASKYSVQQNAGGLTGTNLPVGFQNYLGVTSLSAYAVLAGDYFAQCQTIEGFNFADLQWGTANAKTVTLSFQVYSSLTGTFGGSIRNAAGTRSYPFTYSIPVANTWTSISVTVAGDTSGTWVGATNAASVQIFIGLGVGTTLSGTAGSWSGGNYLSATGATSVVGTNGATFYITGVQLEVGSSATGFEYRQYTTEMQLCQRYYYVHAKYAQTSSGQSEIGVGWLYASNQASWIVYFPTQMRTAPSLVYTSGAYYTFYCNLVAQSITSFNVDVNSINCCTIYNNTNVSGTGGHAGTLRLTSNPGSVAFSSEL